MAREIFNFYQGKVRPGNFESDVCGSHVVQLTFYAFHCNSSIKFQNLLFVCFFSLQTGRNRPPVWPSGFDSESKTFCCIVLYCYMTWVCSRYNARSDWLMPGH